MDDFAGKLIADKYRVGKLICEGESGDFYRGCHEVLDKPVTLKLLPLALSVDSRWVKRFIEDARAQSTVTHPNLLNITDFGTDAQNISYAVYEAVEGRTLADLQLPTNEKTAIEITRQIADALALAHERQLIHGNLCPQNVFVSGNDQEQTAKVFGFRNGLHDIPRNVDARYLAPEQLGDHPVTDARSDIYSLGVMFYEMLSGEIPFESDTVADVLTKQKAPPPPLSAFRKDLHPEIEPIISSAIAIDPEHRYQKMSALAEDLDRLASRVGIRKKAATASADPAGRNIWQTALVVLSGIVILAGALIYATYTRGTDPTDNLQADIDSLPVQPLGPATGAQEEALLRVPQDMSPEELMMTGVNTMTIGGDPLPGGDGYNAWANGGIPPAGAPPVNLPPGGQRVSGEVTGSSQFMPPMAPIEFVRKDILTGECTKIETREVVPCPDEAGTKPLAVPPTTKPSANAKATPTPKPDAPPATTDKPEDQTTDKAKPQPSPKASPRQSKPAKTAKPSGSESLD